MNWLTKIFIGSLISLFCFSTMAQATPTFKVMDDWGGDLEILRSIFSKNKPNLDSDYYIKRTKFLDRGVNLGNAFAYKRESERLLPMAESRREEFRKATFVVLVGFVGPNVDSYDFKTKSFHATFGPTVRSLVGTDIPIYAAPEGAHVVVDDPKTAEWIEGNKNGHAGSKQQIVEIFRMKGIREYPDSRGQLIAERVAFYKFGDDGNLLLGVVWPKITQAEKKLVDTIYYDGKVVPK